MSIAIAEPKIALVTEHEFINMNTVQLAQLTNMPSERWSEYQTGKSLTEIKCREIAENLNISPGTLLDWIIKWRKIDPLDPRCKWRKKSRIGDLEE